MTYPGSPGPDDTPRPDAAPGREPLDPWAEEAEREEAARRAEQGWVSESGGLGPLPARTWTRGTTRVTVGGCCLPLPVGCLTTLVAAAVVGVSVARRQTT